MNGPGAPSRRVRADGCGPCDRGSPGASSARVRADRLLVARGLASTREQAREAILAGRVVANGTALTRPGARLPLDAAVHVVGPPRPYVSRGGIKLEHAIRELGVPVAGRVAMDVGASTGGFTDCLLRHGARRVYAVDVGYGQLAWRLRTDPRVVVLERTNIRYLDPRRIGEPVDLITVDVSFISVTRFLDRLVEFAADGGWMVVLVKPQFEAGRGQVRRGGVVVDPEVRGAAVKGVVRAGRRAGLTLVGMTPSPLLGPSGNAEFFVAFVRRGCVARTGAGPAGGGRAELAGGAGAGVEEDTEELDAWISRMVRLAPARRPGSREDDGPSHQRP